MANCTSKVGRIDDGSDPTKAGRVMQAMMKMQKIVIADLKLLITKNKIKI